MQKNGKYECHAITNQHLKNNSSLTCKRNTKNSIAINSLFNDNTI